MNWGRGYAVQACSDFEARDHLCGSSLPLCHQLHYLQMALEKAAKAHLIAAGSDPVDLQSSHAYIAKVVPIIVRDGLRRTPGADSAWVIGAVRALARRIELLHPQIDANRTAPANCEYPWIDSRGSVVAPAEHNFELNLSRERAAVTLIKEVRARAMELARSQY